MPYRIVTRPRVERDLRKLAGAIGERVSVAIDSLAHNPRPQVVEKVRGTDFWRIRVGDYRILYSIDDAEQLISIVKIGHRREVYRGL